MTKPPQFTSQQSQLILKIGDTLASAAETIASLRDPAMELSNTNPQSSEFVEVGLRTHDALNATSQALIYLTQVIKGKKNDAAPSPEEMEFLNQIAIEMGKLTPIIQSVSRIIVSNTSPNHPPSDWVVNFTAAITQMFRSLLAPTTMLRELNDAYRGEEPVKPVKVVNKKLN